MRNACASLGGDYQLLNDSLFENYNSATYYFDDKCDKTAYFIESLSFTADVRRRGIRTATSYDDFMFLPSYVFKRFCADQKKGIVRFPACFRELYHARVANEDLLDRMLGTKVKNGGSLRSQVEDESFRLGLFNMSRSEFCRDVLPSLYQIMHPEVRDTNVQLLSETERCQFLAALEFMVMLNLKIYMEDKDVNPLLPTSYPCFEPDVTSLTVYGKAADKYLDSLAPKWSKFSKDSKKQEPPRKRTQG